MNYILAIDQSTSATKSLIYNTEGNIIDKASLEHQQIYPQPGWVEHDAEEIWRNTQKVLKTIVERNTALVDKLICLSITNQRETIVVFDRKTGKPLHNAIVWQCRRGDSICAELIQAGHSNAVRQITGLKIDTYFSASKLTWLLRNQPAIRQKLISGEALIGTIDTYLIYRLTGGTVFATDHTNASRTLLYDISQLRWDEGLAEIFEVALKSLPEVRESADQFGETDLAGILEKPLPICGVMGDSQASLFAQRCFKPGMAKVTFGSGSSVLLNIGDNLRFTESGAVSTIAWVYQSKPTYSFEGIINYSGATITWLKDQLELINDASETEALATAVPDNGGVYLAPAFSGLSAPYWNPEARAAIVGMTAYSNKKHIVRAALESIAYQLRDVLDMMRDDAGVTLQSIHGDGGPTANAFLMQFTADIAGLELRASNIAEMSPLGAALSAALGMGIYSSLEELEALPRELTAYQPSMSAEAVKKNLDGWRHALARVCSMNQEKE